MEATSAMLYGAEYQQENKREWKNVSLPYPLPD